jgi:hypothetical protein
MLVEGDEPQHEATHHFLLAKIDLSKRSNRRSRSNTTLRMV